VGTGRIDSDILDLKSKKVYNKNKKAGVIMNLSLKVDLLVKEILDKFKELLLKRVRLYKMILFGSRARGDYSPSSDMDVVVILEDIYDEEIIDYVSDCAWEASFGKGIVVVPVVFSKDEWENSPESSSLLVQAVEKEGLAV